MLDLTGRRDRVLRALVAEGIWPSVLWPHSWWRSDRESRRVSKELLTVPCDFRYSNETMDRVEKLLRSLKC